MRVLMLTNTYLPHVGGVARSVQRFAHSLREIGHEVLVVAPEFDDMPPEEEDVLRVPAVQNFNGSDFSVRLPVPGLLTRRLDEFQPQLVHSHHPFLLGDTALRVASARGLPLVFTHHTMYERYTHYVPGDSPATKQFAIAMATEYANLCDAVIAPSESIAEVLRERGVAGPLVAIPTGVDVEAFAAADRKRGRSLHGLGDADLAVGHVGRLAHEKNLVFLAEAMATLLRRRAGARALIVGEGEAAEDVRRVFADAGLEDRLHMPGSLDGPDLRDSFAAMDLFAFASTSETQGMVLAEAMAAGVPVVALDAAGARELVETEVNGVLVGEEDEMQFLTALEHVADLDAAGRDDLRAGGRAQRLGGDDEPAGAALETVEGPPHRRLADRHAGAARQSELMSAVMRGASRLRYHAAHGARTASETDETEALYRAPGGGGGAALARAGSARARRSRRGGDAAA